ncbi:MAG: NUDIX hydrolase [Bacteroidales bacterium]|nr:NUDIX hydrolase [Bacteroidales bacterium]
MPRVTVGAVLTRKINNETNILLTKRNVEPFKDYWCIPGGHIEENEDAVTAVIREVKEETNLDFKPEFFAYLDEIYPERGVHNVVLLFHGEAANEAKGSPAEVADIGWFSIAEVLKMDLAFRHNEAVKLFVDLLI